jgi:hypothetical protein
MQLHALLQQHETWGLAAAGWHAPYRYKKIRTYAYDGALAEPRGGDTGRQPPLTLSAEHTY